MYRYYKVDSLTETAPNPKKFDKDILTTKNCRRTFLKRFPNSFDEEMIYAS